jgi:hypothetical protein
MFDSARRVARPVATVPLGSAAIDERAPATHDPPPHGVDARNRFVWIGELRQANANRVKLDKMR